MAPKHERFEAENYVSRSYPSNHNTLLAFMTKSSNFVIFCGW